MNTYKSHFFECYSISPWTVYHCLVIFPSKSVNTMTSVVADIAMIKVMKRLNKTDRYKTWRLRLYFVNCWLFNLDFQIDWTSFKSLPKPKLSWRTLSNVSIPGAPGAQVELFFATHHISQRWCRQQRICTICGMILSIKHFPWFPCIFINVITYPCPKLTYTGYVSWRSAR